MVASSMASATDCTQSLSSSFDEQMMNPDDLPPEDTSKLSFLYGSVQYIDNV